MGEIKVKEVVSEDETQFCGDGDCSILSVIIVAKARLATRVCGDAELFPHIRHPLGISERFKHSTDAAERFITRASGGDTRV